MEDFVRLPLTVGRFVLLAQTASCASKPLIRDNFTSGSILLSLSSTAVTELELFTLRTNSLLDRVQWAYYPSLAMTSEETHHPDFIPEAKHSSWSQDSTAPSVLHSLPRLLAPHSADGSDLLDAACRFCGIIICLLPRIGIVGQSGESSVALFLDGVGIPMLVADH